MRTAVDLCAVNEHLSGIERYALDLTSAMLLAAPEEEFDLFFRDEIHPLFSAFTERDNIRFHVLHGRSKLLLYQAVLPAALRRIPADAYVFPSFPVPLLFRKRPVFGLIPDLGCYDCPETMKKRMAVYFRLSYRRMAKRADRIFTISEFSKRRILELFNVPEERILRVPCGLSARFRKEEAESPEQVRKIREKYGLPERFCLSLCTLEPRKNLELLIKVYRKLRLEGKVLLPLVLAGRPGWMTKDLYKAVKQSEGILCPGFIEEDDIAALYRMADCFIFPSVYEGFGLPPLEALSMGTPVVSSDADALTEVLKDHAVFFMSGDEESLAKVLTDLPAILSERTPAEREAGILWSRSFRYEDSAEILLEEIREVVENPFRERKTVC